MHRSALLRAIYHTGIRNGRTLMMALQGFPLTYPSLGSMTLEWDDVDIAREWLRRKHDWTEETLVRGYEKRFARWNGSDYAFAFMGGRVALSACIHALDLGPGDEVILPGYTCVVVPNAFHFAGINTVYADIETETFGLDAESVLERIGPKTKALLIHHLYGLVCRDYEKLLDLASDRGIKIIEDCAHATGARYQGRRVGNLGHAAFYSSEQSKVFTTIQGGMAVTNHAAVAEKLRAYQEAAPLPDAHWIERQLKTLLLNFFQFKHRRRWWTGEWAGLRYGRHRLISTTPEEENGLRPVHYGRRMPAPVAAVGINQLQKIDRFNQRRRETAVRWGSWCRENGYREPRVIPGSEPVHLRYPVLVEPEKKQNMRWARKSLKVQPGVWFVSQIHPVDRTIPGCPNAQMAVRQCINFPGLLQ